MSKILIMLRIWIIDWKCVWLLQFPKALSATPVSVCLSISVCMCVSVCVCHSSCGKWVAVCFWYSLLAFLAAARDISIKNDTHHSSLAPVCNVLPPVAAGIVACCTLHKLRTGRTCWLIWPSLDLPNYFAIFAAAAIRKWRKRCKFTARFFSTASRGSCHRQVAWQAYITAWRQLLAGGH